MAFRKLTDFIQADVIVAMIIDELRAKNVAQYAVATYSDATLGTGSSYKIPGIVDLTVNDYTGTGFTPEATASTNATILMNKYPFINFYLESSDIHEGNALSIAVVYAQRAAAQIASAIDRDVFTTYNTGATADATNLGSLASPLTVTTGAHAVSYVETFATKLREANVEEDGVIVLPSYVGIKFASELSQKVNNERIAGNGIELGYITQAYGFDIYTSNNMPTLSGAYAAVGGKRDCFGLVTGYTHIESGMSETKPASWNQWGQVYGCNVVNAAGLYKGAVKKA